MKIIVLILLAALCTLTTAQNLKVDPSASGNTEHRRYRRQWGWGMPMYRPWGWGGMYRPWGWGGMHRPWGWGGMYRPMWGGGMYRPMWGGYGFRPFFRPYGGWGMSQN
ncbi:unnamed protein product [Strongylus vulgaris]|uniref:Uncharacterized protein n=1 Tax=Strongylus vulgaris TaxID=40348 RepID=A0A3P7JJ01_STRVU|nr:unnamed protein product [Strongylus vulgaris]